MSQSFLFEYACTPLLVANGQLFWTDIDESDSGLWKSDGTPEGTELVKAFGYDYPPRLRVLGGLNGWLLFANDDFGSDRGLWGSDGTYSGTTLLRYFDPAPSGSVEMGGLLYFAVGYENGQLWKSDGTAAGTLLVFSGTTYLQGSTLMPVNDQLFFVAKDPVNNWGLWKSDGTLTGTLLVKGQFHGGAGTQPKYLANVNGALFFEASAMTGYGHELWKSDGTPEGTVMVKDIRPLLNVYDSGSSYPQALTAVGDKLYFAADDGVHGDELWISDGTVTGTYLAADVYPGPVGSDPGSLFYADGTLYFSAKDILLGRELWKLIQVNYRSYLPIISRQ